MVSDPFLLVIIRVPAPQVRKHIGVFIVIMQGVFSIQGKKMPLILS